MKTDTSEPQSVMHGEHDEPAPAAHAQDVHDLLIGYFDALSAGDVPRIAGMLAPCFQIVRGDGTVCDRDGFIEVGLPDVRSRPLIRNLVVTAEGDLLIASMLLDIEQWIGGRKVQSGACQLVTMRRGATGLQFVSVANLARPLAEG